MQDSRTSPTPRLCPMEIAIHRAMDDGWNLHLMEEAEEPGDTSAPRMTAKHTLTESVGEVRSTENEPGP